MTDLPNPNTDFLRIRNLSIRFATAAGDPQDRPHAVRNLSLQMEAGEMVGLVGESGAGKSVTALAIPKLLPAQAHILPQSSICFQGLELLQANAKQMQKVRAQQMGVIFQEPMTALHPAQRIGTQLGEAIRLRTQNPGNQREIKEEAAHLLDSMGLDRASERLLDYPHQLSGGQRQRVLISMALAGQPMLLIADEPTTALDVTIQMQILEQLARLQQNAGMALLLISHDLGVVSRMTTRICVMKDGQIIEEDASDKIARNPSHPYTQSLLRAIPQPPASLPANTSPSRSKPLLQASDLSVHFTRSGLLPRHNKRFQAVHRLTLTVQAGQTLGIVGESGSGKSTIAKALVGIVPIQGHLTWCGNRLGSKLPMSYRRDVQLVFQDPFGALSPRMTLGEIVGEGLKVHRPEYGRKKRKEQVRTLLDEVELEAELMHRFAHELSGGQRQRAALARSLILKPQLLILDEPTSALDMSVQAQIVSLLQDLKRKYETSYIFISHDLKLVQALADRVIVMHAGRIVEEGSRKQIFDSPAQPYTRQLMTAAKHYELPTYENTANAGS